MPNSYTVYEGDGSNRNFPLTFPYLLKSHISLYVDGVSVTFTWLNGTTVTADTAPANGTTVIVRRVTDPDALVNFRDGNALPEVDLNTAVFQSLFIAQEGTDNIDDKLGLNGLVWDAESKRITNVATPTSDNDAANKSYVDTKTASDVAAAAASASAAATSATNAATSATTANTAKVAAEAAQTAAVAAKDGAETAQAAAEAAVASLDGELVPAGGTEDQALTRGPGGTLVWADMQGGSYDPIGKIMAWPAAAVPSGFLECDGSAISRTTYSDLFAIIGTLYGAGDGSTTFNLPDLRGEVIRGFDNGRGVDSGRTLGSAQLGQVGDFKVQLPLIENSQSSCFATKTTNITTNPFGLGDAATPGSRSTTTSDSTPGNWALSDVPYRSEDDESTYETRMRNVALKYIIKYADAQFIGATVPVLPAATTETAGAVELATQAEVDGGTETAKVVTPATLQAADLRRVAPDVIIEDQRATGTVGGSVSAAGMYLAWGKRTLNTEVRDALGVTLLSNEVTLPAGTYYVEAESPMFGINGHRCQVYDETNLAELVLGDSAYSAANALTIATAAGVFTLAGSASISVRAQANYNGVNTHNLGVPYNGSSLTEIYTRLKIWKIE